MVDRNTFLYKNEELDFAFYFKQGENTVTLESVQADMGIEEISLVPAEKLMSYQEYYAAKVAEGVPVISNGDLADPIKQRMLW